jgi:hypothetical protein
LFSLACDLLQSEPSHVILGVKVTLTLFETIAPVLVILKSTEPLWLLLTVDWIVKVAEPPAGIVACEVEICTQLLLLEIDILPLSLPQFVTVNCTGPFDRFRLLELS